MKITRSTLSFHLVLLVAVALISTVIGVEQGSLRRRQALAKPPRRTCRSYFSPRFNAQRREIAYAGKTYEEWANSWQYWASGFNLTVANPNFDITGQYANKDQPTGMFLLGSTYGFPPVIHRKITVPANTPLFATLALIPVTYRTGDPDSPTALAYLKGVLALAGVSEPANATQSELSSLVAKAHCENIVFTNYKFKVDGCNLDPFSEGLIWTKPDHTFSLQTAFGFAPNNFGAVVCGYAFILKPLSKGNHTISASGSLKSNNNTLFWTRPNGFSPQSVTGTVNYVISVV